MEYTKKSLIFFKQNAIEIYFLIAISISILFLHIDKKPELIPSFLVSSTAAILSYSAYRYTKEKFRLDLLDRRVEIYNKTVEFCSLVVRLGGLTKQEGYEQDLEKAHIAAHESFRGIGYHKTQSLFGQDIVELFNKLNTIYAQMSVYGRQNGNMTDKRIDQEHENLVFVSELVGNLPIIFKPYIFFGQYRNDMF